MAQTWFTAAIVFAVVALPSLTASQASLGSTIWEQNAMPQLEGDGFLTPTQNQIVRAASGKAVLIKAKCPAGPADMMVTFSTFLDINPLLVISLDVLGETINYNNILATSMAHWKGDARGNHYTIAKGVPPEGAIVGLANPGVFGQGDEVEGELSIKCSSVMAFDPLFFHHVMTEGLCPVGYESSVPTSTQQIRAACSRQGICLPTGDCKCNLGFVGAACEHSTSDMVGSGTQEFELSIPSGEWRYFRVTVPPGYAKGMLRVGSFSDYPLVVLVKEGEIPTTSSFDLSNFGDWLSQRTVTMVSYPLAGGEKKTLVSNSFGMDENGKCRSDLGLSDTQRQNCATANYHECQAYCVACMTCSSEDVGEDCNTACTQCKSFTCNVQLAACAGSVVCSGSMATTCQSECGVCASCVGSLDPNCKKCDCCSSCVPVSLRCMQEKNAPTTREVFVGIYNHPGFYNEVPVITGQAQLAVTQSGFVFEGDGFNSWVSELYNPFHDLSQFASTGEMLYPDEKKFFYELDLNSYEETTMVNIFKDRLTLVLIRVPYRMSVSLRFFSESEVTHVISSTLRSPKTLFDFNQVEMLRGQEVITSVDSGSLWIGFFGSANGDVMLSAVGNGLHVSTQRTIPVAYVFAFMCFVLFGFCWVKAINGGSFRVEEVAAELRMLPGRLRGLIHGTRRHESMTSLTQTRDSSGRKYRHQVMEEDADAIAEEQYVLRGGRGDYEGI
eukprot:TRINITY_DN49475_c0_g1_i1.p1 TRINITY_DN49475_c0_g1~~TRINITY_DN49475_c0_g1_i1.p1  ORF type:complete len:725 (-),score=92.78 TRINITY_DN49475_c0_g1_i1:93-2267(-)